MKDLITTIAAITILMVFVMQFSANHVLTGRILASDRIADKYETILKTQGSADESQKSEILDKLSAALGCDRNQVIINEGGGEYSIKAPIDNIVACGSLLGISEEENKATYFVKGWYLSLIHISEPTRH